MGELLIAAIRACNLPVDAIRQPIDALPAPSLWGLSDWIGTDHAQKETRAGTGRFLPTIIIVAAGGLLVRIIIGRKARSGDGGDGANLRRAQKCWNPKA